MRKNQPVPSAREILAEVHHLLGERGTSLAQEINIHLKAGPKQAAPMLALILRTHLEIEKTKMEQKILERTIPKRFIDNPDAISSLKAEYARDNERAASRTSSKVH